MKHTHRLFKSAGFFTLALVLTLVSLSACGKNADNPFMDKILGDSVAVPEGVFYTSQVGKYPNNMHELAPYINANRNKNSADNPLPAMFLGNDFNEIRKVFIGKNGVVEDYSFLILDMRGMEADADTVPTDCFNGFYVEADGVAEDKIGTELNAKIVEAWLPESVVTLGSRSFANNYYLAVISMTGVTLIDGTAPDGNKEASYFAFYKTNSLKELFLPGEPPVRQGTFDLVPSALVIHLPQGTDYGKESAYQQFITNGKLLMDGYEEITFIDDIVDSEG
jgi:hypothetical protein